MIAVIRPKIVFMRKSSKVPVKNMRRCQTGNRWNLRQPRFAFSFFLNPEKLSNTGHCVRGLQFLALDKP